MPALSEVLGTRDLPQYLKYLEGRVAELEDDHHTGWAEYVDDEYTSASPLAITADEEIVLPNNGASKRVDQVPFDIEAFYNPTTQVISGRLGDGLIVHVDFKFKAANAAGNWFDVWVDLGGGSIVNLYRRTTTMPKGNNVEHYFSMSVGTFTYDTWDAFGGQVKIVSNTDITVYDIRFVLTRTHKKR